MVTPNMFELEILAESTINNSSDASKALKKIANQDLNNITPDLELSRYKSTHRHTIGCYHNI